MSHEFELHLTHAVGNLRPAAFLYVLFGITCLHSEVCMQ